MKRSVAVTIAGQRYSIKSDADEAYVQSLADMVDHRLRELQQGSKTAPVQALAVLTALQLADEYRQAELELSRERERRASLRCRVRDHSRSIRALLDREVKA